MTRDPQKHFNNIAEKYKDEIPSHTRDNLINRLWDFCSPYFYQCCKVIEIGCGNGTSAYFLNQKAFIKTGIDFSKMDILNEEIR